MYTAYRIERRKFQRLQVCLSALYRIVEPFDLSSLMGDREFEAKTFDLSVGGLSLLTEHYLPVGTKLSFKLIIFESNPIDSVNFYEPLELRGEVRSSFYLGDNEYRIGIAFSAIPEKVRSRLDDFLQSPLRPAAAF
ncbi:MAG: PilZ domain-containing protein [Candidatus Omnitrophota bacterium]